MEWLPLVIGIGYAIGAGLAFLLICLSEGGPSSGKNFPDMKTMRDIHEVAWKSKFGND